MKLDEIALKYGTDKSSEVHNYTPRYENYFEPLRNQKLKILEIGIQNGYSLKMWKEYFANSEIYGLDIVDCSRFNEDRITTIKCDQTNVAKLDEINQNYGPFDIIIDDGSHVSHHMKTTFNHMFPLLKLGGIYVLEDLHCCYWSDFTNGYSFMTRLSELLDITNAHGKCGNANVKNSLTDSHYLKNADTKPLNAWEKTLEYVHLYRSIAFIKKFDFEF